MAYPVSAGICHGLEQAIAIGSLQIFGDKEWVGDKPTGRRRKTLRDCGRGWFWRVLDFLSNKKYLRTRTITDKRGRPFRRKPS